MVGTKVCVAAIAAVTLPFAERERGSRHASAATGMRAAVESIGDVESVPIRPRRAALLLVRDGLARTRLVSCGFELQYGYGWGGPFGWHGWRGGRAWREGERRGGGEMRARWRCSQRALLGPAAGRTARSDIAAPTAAANGSSAPPPPLNDPPRVPWACTTSCRGRPAAGREAPAANISTAPHFTAAAPLALTPCAAAAPSMPAEGTAHP